MCWRRFSPCFEANNVSWFRCDCEYSCFVKIARLRFVTDSRKISTASNVPSGLHRCAWHTPRRIPSALRRHGRIPSSANRPGRHPVTSEPARRIPSTASRLGKPVGRAPAQANRPVSPRHRPLPAKRPPVRIHRNSPASIAPRTGSSRRFRRRPAPRVRRLPAPRLHNPKPAYLRTCVSA